MTQQAAQIRNVVSRSGFANPLTLGVLVEDVDYLKVYADEEELQIGDDYTVTGIGDANGVSIEIIGAEDANEYVGYLTFTALYDPVLQQGADLSLGGTFGRAFEAALDAQNRQLQAVAGRVDRAMKLPADIDGDIMLPPPVDQFGLIWDADTEAFIWAAVNDAGALAASLPPGGLDGQLLAKASDDDFDTEWIDGAFNAAAISFAPAGGIAATNVQTALAELDSEKLSTAAAAAAYQPLDADLTAIAALSTQTFGRSLLTKAAAEDARDTLDTAPYVATRTALKALDTAKETVAILTEAGRQGAFVWMAGNYSTQITADAAEGVYVKANAIASSSGAWVRVFTSSVAPEWFGAVGDGSTDDSTAMQAAIDLSITYGLAIQLQGKTYKLGTMLDAGQLSSSRRLTIRGVGSQKSVLSIAHNGTGFKVGANPDTAYSAYLNAEDFSVVAAGGSTPSYGILAYDLVRSSIRRVRVAGCVIGVMLFGGIALDFSECEVDGNTNGIVADDFVSGAGGGYPNLIAIRNSRIINNTTFGIDFSAGRNLQVSNCDIEGNGTNGVNNSGGVRIRSDVGTEGSLTYAPGLQAESCWFEANSGAAALHLLGGTNSVRDPYFVANANATYDIYIGGGSYRIDGSQHDTSKTTHIVDEGTTSTRNFINNCRKQDGSRANILVPASRCYMPDLGVPQSKQIASVQGSPVALTNNITTAQSAFAAANDTLAVGAATTYRFRAKISLNTGATSHTTSFGFGGSATFTSISYLAEATSSAANTLATPQKRRVETAGAAVLTAASTAVTTDIWIEGVMRINAAGTIIPQVTFSAGPTGTCQVAVDSFFEIEPLGSNIVAAIGPWT